MQEFDYIISRDEDTKVEYVKRANQLLNKAKREFGIKTSEDLDVRQFVIWLIDYKPNINKKTWRQYKSATIYYLETLETQAAFEAIEYIREVTSEGCAKFTGKTSSIKLKKIPLEDWIKLNNYLENNKKYKWFEELRCWLRASIVTGLRPVEWKNVKFETIPEGDALIVKNAKNTNGRAHGETRTLLLVDVNQEDLNLIKSHIFNIRTFNSMGEYQYFYNGCATALYNACRTLWPRRKKHITLYSARHQFSANAKNSGASKVMVAAMMGHAVDITATMHYGRKTAGYETVEIKPIESDMQRVKTVDNTFNNNNKEKDRLKKLFDD